MKTFLARLFIVWILFFSAVNNFCCCLWLLKSCYSCCALLRLPQNQKNFHYSFFCRLCFSVCICIWEIFYRQLIFSYLIVCVAFYFMSICVSTEHKVNVSFSYIFFSVLFRPFPNKLFWMKLMSMSITYES